MADSTVVNAVLKITMDVTETVGTTPAAPSSGTGANVVHNQFKLEETLVAGSDVPVTKVAAFDFDMVGGNSSIDLVALEGTNGATVVGSGLKVQWFYAKALAANANVITLAEGLANGYALMGASWTLELQPGQEIAFFGNDAAPDVAGGDKDIDVDGTDTQGIECMILLG